MTLLSVFRKQLMIGGSALAFATATVFSPLAQAAEDTITWKVQSHWPGSSSSYEDSLKRIKRVLEERTDGKLELELYEAGALFKAQETFNAVSRGVIQMGTISPAYAQDKMSLAGIASGLPFAFRNVWEAAYFHKNMGFEDMLREEAAEEGVYWSTDKVYPTEMVVDRPIESMEDFEGLKIRSSGALQTFLTEAGASASYIPGGELYTALSSGVVDGGPQLAMSDARIRLEPVHSFLCPIGDHTACVLRRRDYLHLGTRPGAGDIRTRDVHPWPWHFTGSD